MSYEGEILNQCPGDINFANTAAVVVSGAKWNPCGHMIFCCGTSSDDSWYFHVAGQGVKELYGIYGFPKFMRGDAKFNQYLAENNKREIRRLDAKISNTSGAYQQLMKVMSDKWIWGVLPHNCAVFAHDLVTAGGGSLDVLLNCPDREFAQKVDDFLERLGQSYSESLPYGMGM